jgi:phage I-like protein
MTDKFQFISQLSAVPADGLARIPILVTGSWVKGGHQVSFTRDELAEAVDNFHKLSNHDLNVDYDHACEDLERAAGEPTPSAGRIVALDPPEQFHAPDDAPSSGAKPRYILYGRYEPTARARTLIKNREYRYVSAAFAKDYPDRKTGESQGLTLTSVALTNQPFLDELPEIWLSRAGIEDSGSEVRGSGQRSANSESRIPNSEVENRKPQILDPGINLKSRISGPESGNSRSRVPKPEISTRLSAEQGGKMAKLTLKCSAEGTHDVYDGDNKVGEIDNSHLCDYAAKHVAPDGANVKGNLSTHNSGFYSDAYASFAREVGAEGRSKEEIRGLVTLALHPVKAEVTLLSEVIGVDGRLDSSRLDALDDSGKISRSAWRRAKEAEQRVQNAFSRGQITPATMATGAPLRLALSDTAAFKALVEDRSAVVRPNAVIGLGGSGSETGESPRQLFSRLVEEKKQQLMLSDARMNELDAHRKAGALVAKENPDLLKNYRSDAKSA